MKRPSTPDMRPLLDLLRRQARAQGIRQSDLAKRLGISTATLKRWLRGEGLDLANLAALMAELGLEWRDLASLLPLEETRVFQYTPAQESFFARQPAYLAYFDKLLAGETPRSIARRYRLDVRSHRRYLATLERLGLIEVQAKDRVKLALKGEPKWSANGPLAARFRDEAVREILGAAARKPGALRLGVYRLLPADRERLETLLSELREFCGMADRRGRLSARDSRAHGVLTVLSPFTWSVLEDVKRLY